MLVFVHEHCRAKLTGRCFENDLVGMMAFRDGRIVRYLEYSDTARMEVAFAEARSYGRF